jgi:ABC-type uncharacterized transport system involved in gliding motility auxiliary subunit
MRKVWRAGLSTLLCVVIAMCLAALSARFGFTADWSAGARASITPQSQALLKTFSGAIQATAYARPGDARAKARLLVARYQRFKPDLALAFVDPDVDPRAVEAAGVTHDGTLVLRWRGRTQTVATLDEQAFSDALVRLARDTTPLVAFITGSGERAVDGMLAPDLGNFVDRLSARGVRAVPLNLAEAAEVPRNAALVVLASPQAALLPASVRKLTDYLADGGNLLWLTEPGTDDLGLEPLAEALGIKRLPGAIVDAAGAGTAGALVATRYPPQAITDGFHVNVLFPRAAALASVDHGAWLATPILESSARSWNQTTATAAASGPDPGALKGPLGFGYALSRLSPSPARNQQRAVVIGDGAFLANQWLGSAGNLAFGERVMNWLLDDEALVNLPPAPPDTRFKPTQVELGVLALGYLIALPILLILIGAGLYRRRRRR